MDAVIRRKEHNRTNRSATSDSQPDLAAVNFFPNNDCAESFGPSMLSGWRGGEYYDKNSGSTLRMIGSNTLLATHPSMEKYLRSDGVSTMSEGYEKTAGQNLVEVGIINNTDLYVRVRGNAIPRPNARI